MQREIDRLFDDFVPSRGSGSGEQEAAVWTPRVDLAESDDAYVVHVDAPGMSKDGFHISWQDDTLTISGERKWEAEKESENLVRVERAHGHFFRSFRLPKTVDGDHISASYDAGVLMIRVPKAEENRPRRIEIQ